MDALEDHLDTIGARTSVRETCKGAVRWPALAPTAQAQVPAADDPYEPLLLLYERGGLFSVEGDFIDLTGIMLLLGRMDGHVATEPVVHLDNATLDALDGSRPALHDRPTTL
ncbi:hypothetical protein V1J52_22420 [Streptomyces sp. TRM 70351]|uniref:hypothetical protein n=1 Tax=Streptomyces sp. TRM 70351 TaxID=3116552 RepID=UPI002E7B7ADF|nr:hypothetical protein [Streptomyces sp. TRM 70351]MEE1930901.1 hypothetical protein [Streptomyces sp. TRM 70351]